jgi:hypothetical protein
MRVDVAVGGMGVAVGGFAVADGGGRVNVAVCVAEGGMLVGVKMGVDVADGTVAVGVVAVKVGVGDEVTGNVANVFVALGGAGVAVLAAGASGDLVFVGGLLVAVADGAEVSVKVGAADEAVTSGVAVLGRGEAVSVIVADEVTTATDVGRTVGVDHVGEDTSRVIVLQARVSGNSRMIHRLRLNMEAV